MFMIHCMKQFISAVSQRLKSFQVLYYQSLRIGNKLRHAETSEAVGRPSVLMSAEMKIPQ